MYIYIYKNHIYIYIDPDRNRLSQPKARGQQTGHCAPCKATSAAHGLELFLKEMGMTQLPQRTSRPVEVSSLDMGNSTKKLSSERPLLLLTPAVLFRSCPQSGFTSLH